jgi:hypothetical protein
LLIALSWGFFNSGVEEEPDSDMVAVVERRGYKFDNL